MTDQHCRNTPNNPTDEAMWDYANNNAYTPSYKETRNSCARYGSSDCPNHHSRPKFNVQFRPNGKYEDCPNCQICEDCYEAKPPKYEDSQAVVEADERDIHELQRAVRILQMYIADGEALASGSGSGSGSRLAERRQREVVVPSQRTEPSRSVIFEPSERWRDEIPPLRRASLLKW